jgi:hypothetical protein
LHLGDGFEEVRGAVFFEEVADDAPIGDGARVADALGVPGFEREGLCDLEAGELADGG